MTPDMPLSATIMLLSFLAGSILAFVAFVGASTCILLDGPDGVETAFLIVALVGAGIMFAGFVTGLAMAMFGGGF